jgi:hypothetical protein
VGLVDDDCVVLRRQVGLGDLAITYGNVSSVTVTICALPVSASASSDDFEPALPSTVTIVPFTDSNCCTVARSCSSSTRRSVTTITLSKIFLSAASCSSDSRCESQPIEFDFPDPAECWIRYDCPGPFDERIGGELRDRIPLVEPREHHPPRLALAVVERLDEAVEDVDPRVVLPDPFPQIGRLVAAGFGGLPCPHDNFPGWSPG